MIQFRLTKIYDSNSSQKSDIAKMIVKDTLNKRFNIEYIGGRKKYDMEKNRDLSIHGNHGCNKRYILKPENYCDNFLRPNCKKICGKDIHDIFEIELDKDNSECTMQPEILDIGNHCIGQLAEEGFINNIDFNVINQLLKINNTCFLCWRANERGFHKSCIKGKNDNLVNKRQVQLQQKINNEIIRHKFLKDIDGLFNGNTLVKNIINATDVSQRTIYAINEFRANNKFILKHNAKLKILRNNCIIDSIKRQCRQPSVKQMAMVEKIVKDFDRIVKIDSLNTCEKYKRYGYVY